MEEQVPVIARLCLALVLVVSGVAVSLVTRRAADGRLARNAVAGIRTRTTMATDAAWRAGHAAARRHSDAAALVFATVGLVALLADDGALFAAVLLIGTVVATALLLAGAWRARCAAGAAGPRA